MQLKVDECYTNLSYGLWVSVRSNKMKYFLLKSFLRTLGNLVAQIIVFLFFLVLFSGLIALTRKSITVLSGFHWFLGLLISIVWICIFSVFCFLIWYAHTPSSPSWLKKQIQIIRRTDSKAGLMEQYPLASISAFICITIMASIYALVEMSYLFHLQGIVEYTGIDKSNSNPRELFFRLYVWQVFDMIPLLNLTKIYDIEQPILLTSFWARTIVLIFRTIIVTIAIAVIVRLVKAQHAPVLNGKPPDSNAEQPPLS